MVEIVRGMILSTDSVDQIIRVVMREAERSNDSIYVFEIDGEYLFSYYFDRSDIFAELQGHYNADKYRFEIPEDDFPRVEELLEENHYQPIRVDDIERFAVVKEQYTEHKNILRNSVIHWSRDGYKFFVMESPRAVEQAVEQGATRLGETELVLGL